MYESVFKQFKIKEIEIKKSLDEAHLFYDELEEIYGDLISEMANKTFLKFDKNLNQLEIEKIKKRSVDLHFLENWPNRKEIDLSHLTGNRQLLELIPFKNRSFLCVLANENGNLDIIYIDRDGNFLIERKNLISDPRFVSLDPFIFVDGNCKFCSYKRDSF